MSEKQAPKVPAKPIAFLLQGAVIAAVFYLIWPYLPHDVPYVSLGASLLGAWLGFQVIQNWSISVAFWQQQRAILSDIQNPHPLYGSKRLANEADLVAWGMRALDGLFLGLHGGVPFFYDPFAPGQGHITIYGAPRIGKTSSIILPALLHWSPRNQRRALKKQGWTVIATDRRGEIAAVTATHRRRLGDRVIILNPWGLYGMENARFNVIGIVLRDLEKNDGRKVKHLIEKFAICLIPENQEGSGDNEVFEEGGRTILRILILWMVFFDPQNANMVTLRRLVFETEEYLTTIAIDLQHCDALRGSLRSEGNELAQLLKPGSARLLASFMRYAKDAVRIFDPADELAESVTQSDFDIHDILDGNLAMYICIDGPHVETHAAWTTMLITCINHTISASTRKSKILLALDEAGTIAKGIPDLSEVMAGEAAKGLRVLNVFHSRSQVDKVLGETTRKLFEGVSSVIQWVGVDDPETADDIAKFAGKKTVSDPSHSAYHENGGNVWTTGWAKREIDVLPADTILQTPPPETFIWLRNRPLIRGELCPYWRVRPWRSWAADNPLEGPPPANDPPTITINY